MYKKKNPLVAKKHNESWDVSGVDAGAPEVEG